MGRLTRWLAAGLLGLGIAVLGAAPAAAFDGFISQSVDSTYGREISFTVAYDGGPPDRLELLLRTPGQEAAFVAPVSPSGAAAAEYVWDTSGDHVTPNSLITYQWRATSGDEVVMSEPATYRYEDDRPGLDWQREQLGEATVHWYGDSETQARRFGELTAVGVQRAETLLGTELAGPVDVFVYATRDDFFGALGPGAREWTGAAAFSELRTIFMWLEGGSAAYLEQAMIHEVTHIVFFDATDNAFHEPARWLNEGLATWTEDFEGDDERAIVELEAGGAGLFSFEAISAQFPIGDRGGRLSYAQGTTMVDMIVDDYGDEAIAAIAAAYQDGASDAEALESGTGITADQLYADFFAEFGVDPPTPIVPEPIAGSNVDRPDVGSVDPGGVDGDISQPSAPPSPDEEQAPAGTDESDAVVLVVVAGASVAAVGAAVLVSRRAARKASS
jgi:Peptidase MA superfamily